VLAATLPTTLVGIAAIATALAGVASVIMAIRKGRSEEHEHALDELKDARAEAERLAVENHELKLWKADHED
jgi:hypothetical protein